MTPLTWQITRFNHIHSYPSDVGQGGELYAQDMVNLRVDRWGHLRPRPPIRSLPLLASSLAPEGVGVTGVASDSKHLYWLRDDGKLFKNSAFPSPSTEREITDVESLSGRLALVQIGDFVIFTSEGHDNGYILYESTAPVNGQQAAHQLNVEAPDLTNATIRDETEGRIPDDLRIRRYFYYKLTYADNNGNENPPTVESSASSRLHVRAAPSTPTATIEGIPKSPDDRMNYIFVYRSLARYVTHKRR